MRASPGCRTPICGCEGSKASLIACVRAGRACTASESVSHRLRLKLPEQNVAMGVVVQRMVNAHCSGFMFTRNPSNGRPRLSSPSKPAGDWARAIVSGEVTPDRFVVSKVTGEIMNRTVSEKLIQHLPDVIAGGVRREPVPDELRERPMPDGRADRASSRRQRSASSGTTARRRTSSGRSRKVSAAYTCCRPGRKPFPPIVIRALLPRLKQSLPRGSCRS